MLVILACRVGTKKCSWTVSGPTTRVCVRTFFPGLLLSSGSRILSATGAAIAQSPVIFGVTLIWSPLLTMVYGPSVKRSARTSFPLMACVR